MFDICAADEYTPLDQVDLAQDLCLDGGARPSSDAEFEAIERCYVGLYHLDVPKMADAGLVEFDSDRRSVAPAE